ncbi:hypothetical protein [uncultured Dialister sp.]|uniref:hypothetical protein n=1 Tax=uncultured Dialister sp. TaxID=278064 RepID=UPI0025D2894B|nr:hypothetical protein [uncultured Dialister sp.]
MNKKKVAEENNKLKGLLKTQKKSYAYMGKLIGTTTGNFSNKINGYTHFTAYEIYLMAKDCGMNAEQVEDIFFSPYAGHDAEHENG